MEKRGVVVHREGGSIPTDFHSGKWVLPPTTVHCGGFFTMEVGHLWGEGRGGLGAVTKKDILTSMFN